MRYKLGQLIEQYDEINDKGEFQDLESLQGINSLKYFQECKSNKNDIDLYRYRICRKGMFAYNRATSRNGEKISIAYREDDDCLISPSYYCFKIVREDLLLADYLMIWLKRPVFDKYARFHSWGSATEFFTFEDFCDTEINLPSLEEQHKIVHDYKVITDRIELLKNINKNLEMQAECIFEDYTKCKKYPTIKISDIAKLSAGGDTPEDKSEYKDETHLIPIYSNGTDNDGLFGYTGEPKIIEPSITISARGYIGYTVIHRKPYFPVVRLISVTPLDKRYVEYLYFYFKNLQYAEDGSAQQQATIPFFKSLDCIKFSDFELNHFSSLIKPYFDYIELNKSEIEMLNIAINNVLRFEREVA